MLDAVVVEMIPGCNQWCGIRSPCMRRFACRKLHFIPDETILCIDDHHERKFACMYFSNTCTESGFARIYDPEKAPGPVMHTPSCGDFRRIHRQSVNYIMFESIEVYCWQGYIGDDCDFKLQNRIDVDRAYNRNGTYEMAGLETTQIRMETNPSVMEKQSSSQPSAKYK